MPPSFDPRLQNFTIVGPDGMPINISMPVVDQMRVQLANLCISWGVQLGLCLMTLLVVLLLTPPSRMRRAINAVHVASLVVAAVRLSLLVQYFPGALASYYVVWTRDRSVLNGYDFNMSMAGIACNSVQFAFIEAALIMQAWGLIKCWQTGWKWTVRITAIILAVATVVLKVLWVVDYIWMLRFAPLPIKMDAIGRSATVLGAASIFFFCGLFATDLTVHLVATRSIIRRLGRGLTNLEILAIGNGVLMILPSIFAGLDVASGLSGSRVLPFDAGSWVMTLVVIGLPLTALIARYRGPTSASPSNQASHRLSLFANGPLHILKPQTSGADDITLDSPTGESFMGSRDATRANSIMSGRKPCYFNKPPAPRSDDLEMGIQVRKDVSVVLGGVDSVGPSRPRDF
ncbi:fungal pheromone mating factor STE2 GPCR-domain-containing protein [Pestalotiopsis sp. NC0098]|nr:fungal pheromone mating factor STE2 GPCR-domain-containing protein [Pestalotiopsis sp. NC0098]